MTAILKEKKLLLLTAIFTTVIIYRLILCFSYTPEISVGETNNIWNALNVAAGKPLYTNPEEPPFEIFQYTPLSQAVIISAAKIIDVNSYQYAYYVMVIGRLFSLLFNLGTFFLVYLLLRNIFHINQFFSISASVLGFSTLTHLAFAIRPDALAMLLTAASIYLFYKAYISNNSFYYILTGLCFSIAFFVKQDAISILSILGLCLLISKKWQSIFIIAISFLLFWGVLAYAFNEVFGKYFINSIVGGLNSGYDLENAISVFKRFADIYGYIVVAGIIIISPNIKKLFYMNETKILLIICIGSFAIAFFASLKVGAWVNYYALFIICFIILVFKSLSISTNALNSREAAIIITALFSFIFLFRQTYHYTLPFLKYSQTKRDYQLIVNSFKSTKELNNYTIFTFDKTLKLLFFKNTILPNTEYYHVSRFKKPQLKEGSIKYIIKNDKLDDSQFSALTYYDLNIHDYSEHNKILNYTIYEYGGQ